MRKSRYSTAEQEYIEKWAADVDLENDSTRKVFSPSTGKRITTLDMAQARKRAIERAEAFKKLRDK